MIKSKSFSKEDSHQVYCHYQDRKEITLAHVNLRKIRGNGCIPTASRMITDPMKYWEEETNSEYFDITVA